MSTRHSSLKATLPDRISSGDLIIHSGEHQRESVAGESHFETSKVPAPPGPGMSSLAASREVTEPSTLSRVSVMESPGTEAREKGEELGRKRIKILRRSAKEALPPLKAGALRRHRSKAGTSKSRATSRCTLPSPHETHSSGRLEKFSSPIAKADRSPNCTATKEIAARLMPHLRDRRREVGHLPEPAKNSSGEGAGKEAADECPPPFPGGRSGRWEDER